MKSSMEEIVDKNTLKPKAAYLRKSAIYQSKAMLFSVKVMNAIRNLKLT